MYPENNNLAYNVDNSIWRAKNWQLISTKSNSKQYFKFKKESYFDRFCDWVGLSKEFHLNKRDFNHKIYIISDSEIFLQELNNSPRLQTLIEDLFVLKIKTFECDGKKLSASYKKNYIFSDDTQYIDKIILILDEINNILQTLGSSTLAMDQVGKNWLNFIKICGVAGSVVAAVIGLDFLFLSYVERLLYDGLLTASLSYSTPIFVIWFFYWFGKFFRTSRTHFVLLTNLFILCPVFILGGYYSLVYLNICLDRSLAEIHYTIVIEKEKHRHRKGGDSYSIIVQIPEIANLSYKLVSSSSLYNQVEIGSKVKIAVKNGYFGYKWVSDEAIAGDVNAD